MCYTNNNICSVCLKAKTALYSVCIQNNFRALCNISEFKNVRKYWNPYSRLLICGTCLLDKEIFVKCQYGHAENKMQETTGHIEDTNCKCDDCTIRFGNLPLLAEVIEKFERTNDMPSVDKQVLETSGSSEMKNTDVTIERIPSTSGCSSASASSSSNVETRPKKIMKCTHCEKIFTHKGDLNKHIRSHTGERPFSCPVCQRQFAHTSNLARHIRVHSGVKPFHCDRCNRDFSRKDKLLMHQKTKLCMNAFSNQNS